MTELRAVQNASIPDGKDIEVELEQHCPTGAGREQLIFPQEILSCDLDQPPVEADHEGTLAGYHTSPLSYEYRGLIPYNVQMCATSLLLPLISMTFLEENISYAGRLLMGKVHILPFH